MRVNENFLTMPQAGNPFHGAAMLDADGREIPITEEMIMQACDELMKQWQFPQRKSAA
ncbi:MAG: hypothetical protein Q8J78_01420 [Moraxellaceae bacterium]|nr:hypothetical protein [Moraxellaceae bacterium]